MEVSPLGVPMVKVLSLDLAAQDLSVKKAKYKGHVLNKGAKNGQPEVHTFVTIASVDRRTPECLPGYDYKGVLAKMRANKEHRDSVNQLKARVLVVARKREARALLDTAQKFLEAAERQETASETQISGEELSRLFPRPTKRLCLCAPETTTADADAEKK